MFRALLVGNDFAGNLGQANYVAANMAYEGLIDDLPEGKVTVIGWGPVGDVGMLKNSPKVKAALEATIGTPCLTSREVVDAMSALAADRGVSSAHFMAIDWRRVQSLPGHAVAALQRRARKSRRGS